MSVVAYCSYLQMFDEIKRAMSEHSNKTAAFHLRYIPPPYFSLLEYQYKGSQHLLQQNEYIYPKILKITLNNFSN